MEHKQAPGPASPATWQVRTRSDFATALLHWIIVGLFLLSLVTGLRIASDALDASWSLALDAVLPQGEVYVLHIWSAWGLAASCIAYVIFLLSARLGARVVLDSSRIRALSSHDRRTRWQSINVIVYWAAFLLVGAATVTGGTRVRLASSLAVVLCRSVSVPDSSRAAKPFRRGSGTML